MKPEIHPEYHDITVKCACGNKIDLGSTQKALSIDICSACHPFFTGKQKLIDTAGRVERFTTKFKDKDMSASAAKKALQKKTQ